MKYRKNRTKKIKKIQLNRNGTNRYVILGILVIFIFFSVLIAIQGVTTGNDLTELEREAVRLNEENKRLSEKLVMKSSLKDKIIAAEDHGFQKPSNIVYLDGEASVATLR